MDEPEDMGDVTFDGGGAIPTTIKSIGDDRELKTAMNLKKMKLRMMGLNMSQEFLKVTILKKEKVKQL